ncbi:MAG: hypothetical protein SXA11_20355 [Cyanobacteriota bacterium]|nr:hypothetical protein [Cyanobacteriota bacterium]
MVQVATEIQPIVKQHDGRIWAESTSGKGSTFSIALPVFKHSPSEKIEPELYNK